MPTDAGGRPPQKRSGRLIYKPGSRPDTGGAFVFQTPPPRPSLPVRLVGLAGKTLIVSGLLVLGFVAYQLWGTGIQYSRAQADLRREFEQTVTIPEITDTSVGRTTTTAFATTMPGPTAPPLIPSPSTSGVPSTALPTEIVDLNEGDPIARLEIPTIGVDDIVVAGVARDDLKKGPGHYPETPLPGQRGNAAIAGHRTTYGAPFYDVNELVPGDEIFITTVYGRFRYVVNAEPRIVEPTDVSVIDPTEDATLTLTSCHPKYSARQRIVITAVLDEKVSSPTPDPTPNAYPAGSSDQSGPDDSTVSEIPGDDQPIATDATSSVDELAVGWFSEPEAWPHTIAYAVVCALVAVAAWWIGKRWIRWAAYLGAVPCFIIPLYFFYENVARLLPPNI